jgi:hypothetical protein
MTLRISADFNTMLMDPSERILINPATHRNLARSLRSGMHVILFDETMEVQALLEFDEADQRWWGTPDWSTSRDLPAPSLADTSVA